MRSLWEAQILVCFGKLPFETVLSLAESLGMSLGIILYQLQNSLGMRPEGDQQVVAPGLQRGTLKDFIILICSVGLVVSILPNSRVNSFNPSADDVQNLARAF
jgi:hypothetical protein